MVHPNQRVSIFQQRFNDLYAQAKAHGLRIKFQSFQDGRQGYYTVARLLPAGRVAYLGRRKTEAGLVRFIRSLIVVRNDGERDAARSAASAAVV